MSKATGSLCQPLHIVYTVLPVMANKLHHKIDVSIQFDFQSVHVLKLGATSSNIPDCVTYVTIRQ